LPSLHALSLESYSKEPGTKPPGYYEKYDRVFLSKQFTPERILEVGVHLGESTKLFAKAYPNAKIVALDIKLAEIDFSACPNVTYLQADQSDRGRMEGIIEEHFPDGIDLVVDDASHIGYLSKATFDIVFPHVRGKGIYIVEDWGTGYWDNFLDGARFQEFPVSIHDGRLPRRIPSHDFGMVGFVKSLVDYTSESDIRPNEADPPTRTNRVASLQFFPGICIAEKNL